MNKNINKNKSEAEEKLKQENSQEKVSEQEETKQEDVQKDKTNQEVKSEEVKEETKELSEAEKLAKAEEAIANEKDKFLRLAAEFDNYRKRTMKEKAELILNGGERILKELLPILDDMDRAEANFEKSEDLDALKEGLTLILTKLKKTLANQGLKEMETANKEFDTDYHEAIAMIPTDDSDKKGKIIDCVQKGYLINEKVIRHAKVAIGQ